MGSKIKTAKRLESLPTPYYTNAVAEITSQTDRGAAIAGSAYLDILLRSAIEKRMRADPTLHDELFQSGPLRDFSVRIKLAYALNITGSWAYADLMAIRDIRNAFAHSAGAINFDTADVAALCRKLWYPLKIRYGKRETPTTPRDIFTRAVELLADALHEDIRPNRASCSVSPQFLRLGPLRPPSPQKPRE
ncbi:MltR family transcriptional regulator [Shumkonia mesophila]|uniref:MltR family transcriptional regulator n=1 Tax=Shumkonia mesophila TaxID=2838854 RepID=UPI003743394C